MNQTSGYGHHQNYAHSQVLKKTLLPGVIVSSVAALVAIIGAALPFVSAFSGELSDSIFTLAFSGGRTFAGVLFIVAVIFVFAPTLGAYFKPTAGQTKRAGFTSIGGGVLGVVTVLLMMFVFEQEGGGTLSESVNEYQALGIDAGFGIGAYLTIAAFIIGSVGGVLFLLKAGPVEHALHAEMAAAMQQAPMGGQPYPQQGGQPYSPQDEQVYPHQQGGQQYSPHGGPAFQQQDGQPYGQQSGLPPHPQHLSQGSGENAWHATPANAEPGGDQVPHPARPPRTTRMIRRRIGRTRPRASRHIASSSSKRMKEWYPFPGRHSFISCAEKLGGIVRCS